LRRYLPALPAALTLFCAWLALSLPQAITAKAGASEVAPSGALDIQGRVRVIDGGTLEINPSGSRLGVRLIGIDAPQANSICGRAAVAQLEALVTGGIRLEEDSALVYDARGLRMYYGYTREGRSIASRLVTLGLANGTGEGKERDHLAVLAAQARAQKQGCAWDAEKLVPAAPPKSSSRASGRSTAPSAPASEPPVLPPGFVQVPIATGLNYPTSFAFVPDGRIFIAEKDGVVRVLQDGAVLPDPLLDLSSQVNAYWDKGMMAVAVDPNFQANGFIYLYYTREDGGGFDLPKTNRLARYTVQGNVALTSTEKVLLGSLNTTPATPSCNDYPEGSDCMPADAQSHIGGSIRFASDGTLFLSTGDAADFNTFNDNGLRPQRLSSMAGKLLRIDRATGQGLPANPFWNGNPDSVQSKVWAYGLRNPFRFNFRPGTTIPYIGDVGMFYWEELNVGSAGDNFGWPCYEGHGQQGGYAAKQKCQDLYQQVQVGAASVQTPSLAIHHRDSRCIVGGTFYTGTTYPEQYQGAYFYGDCVTRYIDYVYVDQNNNITNGPFRFGYLRYNFDDNLMGGPTAIEMGPDGNLYVLETVFGNLSRIEVGPPQAPPAGTSYVSDLAWTSATNGYGPAERDSSNGEIRPADGVSITLNSVQYPKGIGTHADSEIKVHLGKSCTEFTSDIGVDDEVGGNGSVVFQVRTDGTPVFTSTNMFGSSPTQNVNVDLTGKDELVLLVDDGGNKASDHGDWAGARVTCKGVPSIIDTAPEEGNAGVALDTHIAVTFSKPMSPATFTDATVQLTRQGSSAPLAATFNYSPTTRTLFVDPASDLQSSSTYTVTVKGGSGGVKDEDGLGLYQDAAWSFTTNARPSVVISQPLADLRVKVGDVITYTGSATDVEDGAIPAEDLSWEVSICHNCPGVGSHTHQLQTGQGPSGSFIVPNHEGETYFVVTLTAEDSTGLKSSSSVEIHPQMVRVTLQSSPAGLQLVYDGSPGTTPFTRMVMAGSTHSIWAPSPQGSSVFQSWSDGGAQSHDVQVGVTDTTYTAVFSTALPSSTSTPVASPTTVACEVQFSDVAVGSTFYTFVRCLACRGVLGGYEDGTFRPGAGITRGQLAKLVSNAAGYDEAVSGQTFSDVPPGSTFYPYVERIASRGVVGGYADGTFRPGGPATRGQIAKVLSNAAGFTDEPAGQSFPDVGTSDPFYLYVERLSRRGIIGGYADGTFGPGNSATRGQVSKMVANTFFPNCQTP
jgi:glucose/arabinose dehydrogenase